jgi:hypothetical protein
MKRIILAVVCLFVAGVDLRAQGAATFHVFPQLADGVQSDGTFYASTISATNVNSQPATCSIRLYGGISSRLFGATSFTLPTSGAFNLQATLAAFGSTLPLATGYATMTCDLPVTAAAAYLFLTPSRTVLGAATVFPSPPATRAQLLVNQMGGARLALALANDTDATGTYQLTLLNASGQTVATGSTSLPPRSNSPKFLDEVLTIPSNFSIGAVSITSSDPFSVLGLFFIGPVFFSQPATTFAQ